VVIVDTTIDAGAERPAEVTAGTGVAAASKGAVTPARKTKVTVAGPIEIAGTIAGESLGQRISREVDVHSLDGKTVVGKVRAGAFVRVRKGAAPKGKSIVETVGGVSGRVLVDTTALTAEPIEMVLADPAGKALAVMFEDAELYADVKLGGASRARLAKGTEVVIVEQKGEAARVTTYGAYELDGWTFAAKLGDPGSVAEETSEPPSKPRPTHEVFVDAPIFAGSDGKKQVGQLRGGALVAITQKPQAGRARVRTLGDVRIEGWVDLASLDELESSVWLEP
jgi:hypothetical protein